MEVNEQFEKDKQSVEAFLNGESEKFQYNPFKRLVLTDLVREGAFHLKDSKICGFDKEQIFCMAEHPEKYGKSILKLSNFMYLKSGYYKRLIDYFANQAKHNYTIDTHIRSFSSNNEEIKTRYLAFATDAARFRLKTEIQNIMRQLYKNDVCFAYLVEKNGEMSYAYLDPMYCTISSIADGGVFEFYINVGMSMRNTRISNSFIQSLPEELLRYIEKNTDEKGRCFIPLNKSLCIKYNNDFLFPFPPFFMMIADILTIDDYKDLAKAQSINDAYKLLTMKIPTKDGEVALDNDIITAFTSVVLSTIQNNIGVITTPFDMKAEEFSSSSADDRDTVSDAVSWAFKNVGVSEALMSGASSGSELKLSILNDSGDIFRIYRMLERWIALQLKMRKHNYKEFAFEYKILDMTIFNEEDYQANELKAAQSGLPNKMRLAASYGISPEVVLGNSSVENDIFGNVFDNWQPLKTSYTQSNGEGGRPAENDTEISEITETQRENDSNSTANRV